ncbi:serine/threonine-protein kinase Sgk2 [Daldinia grandis]|nr:serine/threonine-protein kinase Sgk2 [Daldinia grandis]
MTLSEEQVRVIENYPLKDLLSNFPAKLCDLKASNESWRSDIASLLLVILDSATAFNLPASDGNGNVADKLFTIQQNIAPTFKGTPIKTSSSRLADSETREIVETKLFEEIKNCTFRNVGGFWDKFFDPKSWRKKQNLRSLEEHFLNNVPYKLHTTKTTNQFKERKDVLIVEKQKKLYNTSKFKANFLQLTCYIFDRSGAYSLGLFDIHNKPDKFARTLINYTIMDNDTIGLDIFVKRQDKHRYVTLDDTNRETTRIRLNKAMIKQNAIVCRGTTCYEIQNGHVAKFSWASDKRKLKVEQLNRAETMDVEGVARVVAHRRITSIAKMRKGLQFLPSTAHRFQSEEVYFDDPPFLTKNTNSLITNTLSKRKSSSDHTDDVSGSKKQRSNSQKSKLSTDLNNPLSTSKTKPSLYTPGEDLWENRIYSCLVVSPAGRVISKFKTTKKLLESERNTIKVHRSLYVKGKILYRDIFSSNIIITKPKVANGFKGMLIDLNLAKVRDSGPNGARHQTGTMQFMAVEVLRKTDHIYRHDFESFFYPPKESLLRRWEIGSFRSIAQAKAGDMTVDGLEGIMGEFPKALDVIKPLCLRVRKILFPLDKEERMSFGTPAGDPDQVYRPIIAAYDETISRL